jgi:hypothetical protein
MTSSSGLARNAVKTRAQERQCSLFSLTKHWLKTVTKLAYQGVSAEADYVHCPHCTLCWILSTLSVLMCESKGVAQHDRSPARRDRSMTRCAVQAIGRCGVQDIFGPLQARPASAAWRSCVRPGQRQGHKGARATQTYRQPADASCAGHTRQRAAVGGLCVRARHARQV